MAEDQHPDLHKERNGNKDKHSREGPCMKDGRREDSVAGALVQHSHVPQAGMGSALDFRLYARRDPRSDGTQTSYRA